MRKTSIPNKLNHKPMLGCAKKMKKIKNRRVCMLWEAIKAGATRIKAGAGAPILLYNLAGMISSSCRSSELLRMHNL